MKRLSDGSIRYSPSDLTTFMESPFAAWMRRYALDHPEVKPETDPEAALFGRYGDAHERRVLQRLREAGLDVVEITDGLREPELARAQTVEAIRAQRDVVYQPFLELGPFGGMADFLVHPRVAARAMGRDGELEASGETDAYEIWDAKLAYRAKPEHLVQMCAYAEMLEAIQGVRAEHMVVALGNGEFDRSRVADAYFYYQSVKRAFLDAMAVYDENDRPLPESGRKHRGWQPLVDAELAARDHTSRVARITRAQCEKLARAGIDTMAALADSTVEKVAGIGEATLARLREQARLQHASIDGKPPQYRVLDAGEVQAGKGLSSLPDPSPGDVFFDIEGDPMAHGGLEYLWGVAFRGEDGQADYRAFWAHDPAEEKRAFEDFIDWVCERRIAHPELHIYHYASYEMTAIKRLMGRTGSREAEIDDLLMGRVFIDLYPVVRHAVRVGEPGYSLKNVEKLYRGARETDVTSGLGSVVEYDAWRASGEPGDPAQSETLARIRDYNADDCQSTLELEAWLRARKHEHGVEYVPPPEPRKLDEKKLQEIRERQETQRQLVADLEAALPEEPPVGSEGRDARRVHRLLTDLVEFHSREARPVYWELYERAGMTEDERAEQSDCLAGLVRTARKAFPIKSSRGYEYAFDPDQDTRVREGKTCRLAQDPFLPVEIAEMDPIAGRIVLKLTDDALRKSQIDEMPERLCLIRFEHRSTGPMEASIARTAGNWLVDRDLPPALDDYLFRRPPRIEGQGSGPLRGSGEPLDRALTRIAGSLHESTLSVQGPPGSGKTTMGAQAICALIETGKVVGITSNSHAVVENLMHACGERARERGQSIRLVKVGSKAADRKVAGEPDAIGCESKAAIDHAAPGTIVGATAWCFSRPELEQQFDHLFVDEAGQFSLANLVAVGRSAKNLVLLGDPAQLAQPLRGVHPGESGGSALDYVMPPGHSVLDSEHGLFLEDTWRLHPELCRFVSETFYEGKLEPAEGNERRVLFPAKPGTDAFAEVSRRESGIVFLPVDHTGNRQSSPEEVDVIARVYEELLGRRFRQRNSEGESEQHLSHDDILIVAPYNLQVGLLKDALPAEARVGTVDKFQGQQAPVVIVSMCASDAGLAPRGIGFLLNPNRLNVAVSRAQSMSIVVGSPEIARAACGSVREVGMVNSFCRVVGGTASG